MSIPLAHTDIFHQFLSFMPTHWQRRQGSLGPVQVMISLMSMSVLGTTGYEQTLAEMKRGLGDGLGWKRDGPAPSASGLAQARRKFDAKKCSALVSKVYALCSSARTSASLGYGGFRLLAVDGTKLPLPAYRVFQEHFGCPSQGDAAELRCPQASLTLLWDVGANQPVTWELGTYKTSEQEQTRSLTTSLQAGDLLLADRNFPSRRLLTSLHRRGVEVLMRARTYAGGGTMCEITAFIASGVCDAIVTIETRDDADHVCVDLPTIRVRLLRDTLPDGTIAVYLTSLLDQQRHPAATLITLYAQRWRIETAFRELKLWHGLQHFHTREVAGIAQEIAAVMIFQLLASEVEAQARMRIHAIQTESEKPVQQPLTQQQLPDRQPSPDPSPSVNQASPQDSPEPLVMQTTTLRFNRRIIADSALNLIRVAILGQDIEAEFSKALKRIWRYRQRVRPGRSFPRTRKSAPLGWKKRGTKGKGRA